MNELEYRVSAEHHQKTVQYIALRVLKISPKAFRSMKFSGGILVDGGIAKSTDKVREGQKVELRLPRGKGIELPAHDVPFTICFEDEFYYVIDKPAPLPTMHSAKQKGETLESGLYQHLGCPEGYIFRPVNRLDKGTSGLMVVAKDAHAQQLLQKALHTDDFIREYTALCEGVLPEESGTVCAPIAKPENGIRRFVDPAGKPSVTHYRVLKKGNTRSLVQLRLETGRTHQIRVHMSHIGCPIAGDYVYGKENKAFSGRFALHSSYVSFIHPIKENRVEIVSKAPQMWYDMTDEMRKE